MKIAPKTRPTNVMSFILEGCWPLDGFDQRELRQLSKIAKRNGVRVADVIYGAIEAFVAKCEAEADLEEKVIKFPTVATAVEISSKAADTEASPRTNRIPKSSKVCSLVIANLQLGSTCSLPLSHVAQPHNLRARTYWA